jgi:hypothetical protein
VSFIAEEFLRHAPEVRRGERRGKKGKVRERKAAFASKV